LDRRAQATFVSNPPSPWVILYIIRLTEIRSQRADNPNSLLNQGPEPTFTSRYADPNHPAASGDIFGLLTGGHVTREKVQTLKGDRHQRSSRRRDRGSYYCQDDYAFCWSATSRR
jgi:hypothetical protein